LAALSASIAHATPHWPGTAAAAAGVGRSGAVNKKAHRATGRKWGLRGGTPGQGNRRVRDLGVA